MMITDNQQGVNKKLIVGHQWPSGGVLISAEYN